MPRISRSFTRRLVFVIAATGLLYLIYSLTAPYRSSAEGSKRREGQEVKDIQRVHSNSRSSDPDLSGTSNNPLKTNPQSQDDLVYDDLPFVPKTMKTEERVEDEGQPDNDLEELDFDITSTPTTTTQSTQTTRIRQSPLFSKFRGPENAYQKAIVNAFLHAWNAYRKYAWGMDELKPLSKTGQQWMGVGLTIVDSLDTIIIMGLTEEYKVAREWIATSLNFEFDGEVQLFEMTIRTLGGLLSAYHLTGDELFLNKAIELGNKFSPCFTGVTKIPCNRINLRRLQPTFVDISTAECGSIQLEFRDLSRSSNDSKFESQIDAISRHLHGLRKLDGLVSCMLSPSSGTFQPSSVSVGASADSYYEYLLKQWIQTGKTANWLRDDYLEAVNGIQKHLLRYSEPNKLAYVGALPSVSSIGRVRNEMEHLSCFLPGTLALGVIHGLNSSHLTLAAELTKTCQRMYDSMPTKLSPEIAVMNTNPSITEDIYTQYGTRYNLQRPETVESLFYMHRATRDRVYRDWGWKIFQAFETHTRLESGYASIDNVLSPENPGHKDKMETFYLAETLKYLYLLYSDDPDLLPLDRYVMNTEAHPLPIYSS